MFNRPYLALAGLAAMLTGTATPALPADVAKLQVDSVLPTTRRSRGKGRSRGSRVMALLRRSTNARHSGRHADPAHFHGFEREVVQGAVDKRARKALKLGGAA